MVSRLTVISINIHVPDDPVGIRVGVFSNYEKHDTKGESVLHLLGYGVYEGLFHLFDDDSEEPFVDREDIVEAYRNTGKPPVPRIKLDSGDYVWGSFCYWDLEEDVKEFASECKVVNVSAVDFNDEVHEGLLQYEEWKSTKEQVNVWATELYDPLEDEEDITKYN